MTASDPARLRELAERVQRASGPDRELDIAVWALAKPSTFARHLGNARWRQSRDLPESEKDARAMRSLVPPEYTGSLDAAMSLMPEGWRVAPLIQDWHTNWLATLMVKSGQAGGHPQVEGNDWSPSPALALLEAVLLAMAHDAEAAR
jgi:hypothetical protein